MFAADDYGWRSSLRHSIRDLVSGVARGVSTLLTARDADTDRRMRECRAMLIGTTTLLRNEFPRRAERGRERG